MWIFNLLSTRIARLGSLKNWRKVSISRAQPVRQSPSISHANNPSWLSDSRRSKRTTKQPFRSLQLRRGYDGQLNTRKGRKEIGNGCQFWIAYIIGHLRTVKRKDTPVDQMEPISVEFRKSLRRKQRSRKSLKIETVRAREQCSLTSLCPRTP